MHMSCSQGLDFARHDADLAPFGKSISGITLTTNLIAATRSLGTKTTPDRDSWGPEPPTADVV